MTPMERAARALCEAEGRDPNEMFGDAGAEYPYWHLRLDDARAVLQAIREPSERMVEAGIAGIDAVEGDCATDYGTAAGWQAMIDAALEEE